MKIFQKIVCLLALLFTGAFLCAADPSAYMGKVSVNSVLATIDGEPVTLLDVVQESGPMERELAAIYTGERLNSETLKLRKRILNEIVMRKLVYKEYKKEPFEIPSQMVDSMLERHAKAMGGITMEELEKRIKKEGMTMADYRNKIREQIAVDILLIRNCDKMTVVTPKDVFDEYQAHPELWTKPEQLDLQVLQINKENAKSGNDAKLTAEKLKSSIKNADDVLFAKFIDEYSDAPQKISRVSGMELQKLRPEFQSALKDRTAGEVIGPVETPEAFFFIRITTIHKADKIPFEKVSKELFNRVQERETRKRRTEYENKLREKALINYYI